MNLFVNNSGLESDFSGLKDPLAIPDSIKNVEYWYKKREINKKNLKDIKKKKELQLNWKIKTNKETKKLTLISFLTEETMQLNS